LRFWGVWEAPCNIHRETIDKRRNTSGMHFELFSGVGFHLARGMEGIKIHGAIHVLPLIIKLPESLAGCCQGILSLSECFFYFWDAPGKKRMYLFEHCQDSLF